MSHHFFRTVFSKMTNDIIVPTLVLTSLDLSATFDFIGHLFSRTSISLVIAKLFLLPFVVTHCIFSDSFCGLEQWLFFLYQLYTCWPLSSLCLFFTFHFCSLYFGIGMNCHDFNDFKTSKCFWCEKLLSLFLLVNIPLLK